MSEVQNNIITMGLSLNQKWGTARVCHNTIVELGDPRYIRFLFNPETKKLAIQSCSRKSAECFKVPEYDPDTWDFRISSMQMVTMIYMHCEWNKDKTYRLSGQLYPEYNLVEFNLNKPIIVCSEEEDL